MKITQDSFQSSLATEIMRYISLKQALGRRFETASIVLLGLDRFLYKLGKPSPDLTAETFKQWCQTLESVSANTRLARMRVVRNFCLYRRRRASACFVPDPTQFPPARPTVQPYVFSEPEMARLLSYSACISGSTRSPLRGAATRLAIILLYPAGLRRRELLRLTVEDYDLSAQTLLIRASKFHKSRLLPLSDDVAMEMEQFLKMHKAIRPPLPPVEAESTPVRNSEKIYTFCCVVLASKSPTAVTHAFTISVSVSQSMFCSAGTAIASMYKPSCRSWLPIWATFPYSPLTITCVSSNR